MAHCHEHVFILLNTNSLHGTIYLLLAKRYIDYLTSQLHHCEDGV
jgi:hypothetical protein